MDADKKIVRNGKEYLAWQYAGGPKECSHGYAAGIPCPDCEGDAATRLSPQPETAQGEGCPWRFPSECPDCNPKPDQQAQPQPAESDGFEEWWKEKFDDRTLGWTKQGIARAAWQASRQSILAQRDDNYQTLLDDAVDMRGKLASAEAKLSSLLAQKPEATVSDEDIQLGLDIYEDRPQCAEYRAFKDLQVYSQLFKDC